MRTAPLSGHCNLRTDSLCHFFMAAGALHAQSVSVQANIPFDFVVGNSTFHAGTYTIRPISNAGDTTMLQSTDANDRTFPDGAVHVCV